MQINKRTPTDKDRKRFEKRYGIKLPKIHVFSLYYGRVMTFITAVALIGAGTSFINTGKQYFKTMSWENNVYAFKMADVPSDMLVDTGSQIKIKNQVMELYKNAINKDGSITITAKKLDQMNNLIKQIKTGQNKYQGYYKAIKNKYDINRNINAVFDDDDRQLIKASYTPAKIKTLIDDEGAKLNVLYQQDKNDAFVKRESIVLKDLNDDIKRINQAIDNISEISTVKKGIIEPASYVTPKIWIKAYSPLNHLHYGWNCLNSIINVQRELNDVLANQQSQINLYSKYISDEKAKKDAYSSIMSSHLYRSSLYSSYVSSSSHALYVSSSQLAKSLRQSSIEASKAKKESEEASRRSSAYEASQSKAYEESRKNAYYSSQSAAKTSSIRQSQAESASRANSIKRSQEAQQQQNGNNNDNTQQ